MEIQIEIPRQGSAIYLIEQVDPITFQARLKDYTGKKPPVYIKFYKTDMGWSSAFEDADLIAALGDQLDFVIPAV